MSRPTDGEDLQRSNVDGFAADLALHSEHRQRVYDLRVVGASEDL